MNTIMWILGLITGAVVAGSILYDVGRSRGYDEGIKHERKRINTYLESVLTFEDRRAAFTEEGRVIGSGVQEFPEDSSEDSSCES